MLVTRGVSDDLSHLDDVWVRQYEPFNGAVHYVSLHHSMDLFLHGGTWCIVFIGIVLARADSEALHPHTVYRGEWRVQHSFPGGWRFDPEFHLAIHPSAFDHLDLGADIFMRLGRADAQE